MSKVGKRIVFGTLMIVAAAGLLALDWRLQTAPVRALPAGLAFAALILVLEIVAFGEMARLIAGAGVAVLPISCLAGSALLGTAPFWTGPFWMSAVFSVWTPRLPMVPIMSVLMMLILCGIFAEQMFRGQKEDALRRIGAGTLAVMYLGMGGAVMLGIRLAYGVPTLVLFLAAVKFTDIGAYFAGTAFGKHKLIPWLSPGKSWEGLAGGLIAAAGISLLLRWALGIPLSFGAAAIFGIVVGLAGQFGDLCESLLKRSANLKDSGAAVPEFGGVLDIIDSPLLAAPAAAILLAVLS